MLYKQITALATLSASATPERPGSSGNILIGEPSFSHKYDTATHICYSRRVVAYGGASITLDLLTNDATPSAAVTPAVAQVERATAVGTISTAGNATVTVTSVDIAGSPLALSVPVLVSDTASAWAAKVRAKLQATPAITANFTVGGAGAEIQLTRKIDDVGLPNDTTLNIALANGTCAGIVTAATSTNVTTGVVAAGAFAYGADGDDAEGLPLPELGVIKALMIQSLRGDTTINDNGTYSNQVSPTGVLITADKNELAMLTEINLSGYSGTIEVIITVVATRS